jgi:hypothetical protein
MALDARDEMLIAMVIAENGISTEDPRIDMFTDDRRPEDDTINRCVKAGRIKQIGDSSSDNYSLVPGWWPYANQAQADAARSCRSRSAESAESAALRWPVVVALGLWMIGN